MHLELTDAEVLKLQRILKHSSCHFSQEIYKKQFRNEWHNDWLQIMAKLEIHLQNPNFGLDEPPLVEPSFDEYGRPCWPS